MSKEEMLDSYNNVLMSIPPDTELVFWLNVIKWSYLVIAVIGLIIIFIIYKQKLKARYFIINALLIVAIQIGAWSAGNYITERSNDKYIEAVLPKLQSWAIDVFEREYVESLPTERFEISDYVISGSTATVTLKDGSTQKVKSILGIEKSKDGSNYMEARWVDVPEISGFVKTPYYESVTFYDN